MTFTTGFSEFEKYAYPSSFQIIVFLLDETVDAS